jgi:thiosulfate/3-mercaptopyruvate sulfurtransferase
MRRPRTSPLRCVDQLAADLACGTAPVLLDVRWHLGGPPGAGLEEYREGHIPGARFLDLDVDLAAPANVTGPETGPGPRGRHPLPDPETFAAAMRRAGVSDELPVVVCDSGDGSQAARAWWLLRDYGHPDVRVLDGGFAAWKAAGHAVETGDPEAPAAVGDFEARLPGLYPVIEADEAAALAAAEDGILFDARAGARFRGEVEPVDPAAGHIPGAKNAPTMENVAADGRFLPGAVLAERFAGLGVAKDAVHDGDVRVGVYCGSGVTAMHEVLAMAVAGFDPVDVQVYADSWSGWTSDPSRPVETGD